MGEIMVRVPQYLDGTRNCEICHEKFPLTPGKRNPLRCPACRSNATQVKNLRSGRKFRLGMFKLTTADYELMLNKQRGVCAICSLTPDEVGRLHVDHDHSCCPGRVSCGKCVRGLACRSCNQALGLLSDDPERVTRLIRYLKNGVK